MNVIAGVRHGGKGWKHAQADGIATAEPADAVKGADIIAILTPDMAQAAIYRETIEIICLPLAIPDKVVINIANLDLHETVQIADVVLPEGVKAVYDNNYAVLGIITTSAEDASAEGA